MIRPLWLEVTRMVAQCKKQNVKSENTVSLRDDIITVSRGKKIGCGFNP
jgi:hypothetical protein